MITQGGSWTGSVPGVEPGADIVNGTTGAIAEANWLPKVGRQHQTGANAYRGLLYQVARLIIKSSSHARANILSFNLDN
ncbi:hypothetical protein VCV18_008983 [Metarhizium anisopliae]